MYDGIPHYKVTDNNGRVIATCTQSVHAVAVALGLTYLPQHKDKSIHVLRVEAGRCDGQPVVTCRNHRATNEHGQSATHDRVSFS